MKWLTRISMPSIFTVLLMLSTYGMVSARTTVGIKDSATVHIAASTAAQVRSTDSSTHRRTSGPRAGCQPEQNPNVPKAAFTVFEYLLAHNYSPPKGYKGNTPYGDNDT